MSVIANIASGDVEGVQIAPLNLADDMTGIQFGVVNISHRLYGIQVGAINIRTDGRGIPFMIGVNAGK